MLTSWPRLPLQIHCNWQVIASDDSLTPQDPLGPANHVYCIIVSTRNASGTVEDVNLADCASQGVFGAYDRCGVFKSDSPRRRPQHQASGGCSSSGDPLTFQLWDTAGQERFRSVTRSYYRGSAGALLVYDITSRQSFNNLDKWLADCRALASPHLVVALVGNKLDREQDREVEYAEGSRWAQENGKSSPPPAFWRLLITLQVSSLLKSPH